MWACPFIWGLPARMDGNHCWAGPLRRRDLAGPLENSWKDPANLRLLREVRGNDQEIKCTTFVFFALEGFNFFAVQLLWWQNAFWQYSGNNMSNFRILFSVLSVWILIYFLVGRYVLACLASPVRRQFLISFRFFLFLPSLPLLPVGSISFFLAKNINLYLCIHCCKGIWC